MASFMTDPCPFSTMTVRSSVFGCDVLFVKDRMRLVPKGSLSFTWRELMSLLDSGVTSEDLPRLVKIRDQFQGTFVPRKQVPA
jgi:hypothetical protein